MSTAALSHNLLSWMLQTVVLTLTAALLPMIFRVRHPRTQLYYCHAALAFCLFLPFLEPRRHEGGTTMAVPALWLLTLLGAGILLQLCRISLSLWRIRRSRIAATPLYPIPDAMRAASAITHADALFCISEDAAGPMMLGWLAPVVLLPGAFLGLDEEAQCGIACHELLHVKRGDWLVTLIEGLAGALFWFNPGVWLLLSEARLARELLVDAESVRLTAAREPYIDALLAIARERSWREFAPAPSFLRRSHLTQRMQFLLSDAQPSAPRVARSYCSIAVVLGCSIWLTSTLFPLSAHSGTENVSRRAAPTIDQQRTVALKIPASPLPAVVVQPGVAPDEDAIRVSKGKEIVLPAVIDPYEPVNGGTQIVSTPIDRASALSLLRRARQQSPRHAPGTFPYRFTISFTAGGGALDAGQGELTETWMTGQRWSWTASLGGFSHTRLLFHGQLLEDRHVTVIPMRAHMLRNEVFWAIRQIPNDARLRTASILWQGKPATCILRSEGPDGALPTAGRQWNEEELCFDDSSGAIVVHSIAPGTYAQFEYEGRQNFHGWPMADRIRTYVAGSLASDASFKITDADTSDEASLNPAAGMSGTPWPVELGTSFLARIDSPEGEAAGVSQPVIVHAEIDGDGNVVETEISTAANPALAAEALRLVGKMNFGHTGSERQGYFDVRFVPQSH
jgi:beta-lactamase regulating signal transducer with metallopeptidase domain